MIGIYSEKDHFLLGGEEGNPFQGHGKYGVPDFRRFRRVFGGHLFSRLSFAYDRGNARAIGW